MRQLYLPFLAAGIVLTAISITACGEEAATLLIDLRSDFAAGTEVATVGVQVRRAGTTDEPLAVVASLDASVDLLAGERIAELPVSLGTYEVTAILRDTDGEELVVRRVVLDVAGQTGVTVIATRSCLGVVCGDGTTCVGGLCVDPTCTPETPASCPPEQCVGDAECGNECVVASCGNGICYTAAPDDGLCAMDQTCDVDMGCTGGVIIPPPPMGRPDDALTGVQGLAIGARHACARVDGDTRCWGDNSSGQLGDGTTTSRTEPGTPIGATVGQLVAGDDFTCGIGGSEVLCWGDNSSGQTGQAGAGPTNTPTTVTIPEMTGTPLGAGGRHVCVSMEGLCISPGPCDFDIFCWGDNASGQIGDGTTTQRNAATRIVRGDSIWHLTGGAGHTCMDSFQGVFCWGDNASGQLGLGDTAPRTTPAMVRMGAFRANRALVAGAEHTCLVASTELECWGRNDLGQLGNGTMGGPVLSPTATGLTGVTSFALGANHGCAILDDGTLHCWGDNASGQLGLGDDVPRGTPTAVTLDPFDATVAAAGVFAAGDTTCVITTTDDLLCWGDNADGQIGDGTTMNRDAPAYVLDPLLRGG